MIASKEISCAARRVEIRLPLDKLAQCFCFSNFSFIFRLSCQMSVSSINNKKKKIIYIHKITAYKKKPFRWCQLRRRLGSFVWVSSLVEAFSWADEAGVGFLRHASIGRACDFRARNEWMEKSKQASKQAVNGLSVGVRDMKEREEEAKIIDRDWSNGHIVTRE